MEITTKRDLGNIEYGDVVNYRKFRAGTRVDRGTIGECERCGEAGAVSAIPFDSEDNELKASKGRRRVKQMVTHRTTLKAGPFPHWSTESGDHCIVYYD